MYADGDKIPASLFHHRMDFFPRMNLIDSVCWLVTFVGAYIIYLCVCVQLLLDIDFICEWILDTSLLVIR